MSSTTTAITTLVIPPFNTTINPGNNKGCDLSKITTEAILYAVFIVLIMITSITGNLFVVCAVALSKSLKRRVTFYFIASLACSDFCFAIFQLPFRISMKLHGDTFCHELPTCYVMIITDAFANVASILNLLLISLDRFVAIKFPFRHSEILSTKNSKKLIIGVWIISAIWSFIGIFRWSNSKSTFGIKIEGVCYNDNYNYYATSSFGIYVSVLIIITCTYITILHVALSQIRAIEASQVTIPMKKCLLDTNIGSPDSDKVTKRRKRKLTKELKATKSVAIVYLAYVICWLPCYVINIIILINSHYFPNLFQSNPNLFLFLYYTFIEILPAISTMVNPFIYSFSNRQFRGAFKVLLSKLLGVKFGSSDECNSYNFDNSSCPVSPNIHRVNTQQRGKIM